MFRKTLTRSLSCLLLTSVAFAFPQNTVSSTSGSSSNLVVDLGYAKYQGSVNPTTGNTEFLGIRFAAAPTGALRWKEPQTPSPTAGIQPANALPSGCPQAGIGIQATNPFTTSNLSATRDLNFLEKRLTLPPLPGNSEDCLFLNVYSPGTLSQSPLLPVVIFIHGGGYVAGEAAFFDGNDLIKDAGGGVVVVLIQYRIGIYGFLAGGKVKAGGVLNAGLLDQQFAFRWVQQNIRKFGGDPLRVTIWGESAGAGSVLQHIVANNGNTFPPLFRAAITSSTFLPSQYRFDDAIPEAIYSQAVSGAGCSTAADTLQCLRNADSALLQTVNIDVVNSGFFGTYTFVPVVDGTFITDRPSVLLSQHKTNGLALLSVTNSFEGRIFVNPGIATALGTSNYIANLFPKFDQQQIAAATAQYAGLGSPIDQAIAIYGESIFICPTYFQLNSFFGRSFKGEFAIPPANHGDDLFYYFPSDNPTGVPAYINPDFDKAFPDAFLNFVISLNPNIKTSPDITPFWNVWNGRTEMLFNHTDAGAPEIHAIVTSSSLLQRCRFWESVGAYTAQ